MSDQMSRRGFMGAAATGAFALAGVALAGCSNTSASSEKSSEKEKAVKPVILVTSFGTSYNDSRHITIGAIEDAIREKYWQDYDIRRAFTAQIIIDKLKKRDGITIDNMTEALDRCVEDGVKEIVVQPTHLMGGLEYTDVKDELDKYADKFDKISLGDPLLTSDDDYKKVAAAIKENMASFDDGKTALCLMGHGTEADSNADYAKMQEVFKNEGLTQSSSAPSRLNRPARMLSTPRAPQATRRPCSRRSWWSRATTRTTTWQTRPTPTAGLQSSWPLASK